MTAASSNIVAMNENYSARELSDDLIFETAPLMNNLRIMSQLRRWYGGYF